MKTISPLAVISLLLVAMTCSMGVTAGPAAAAASHRQQSKGPGSFTGYGFDTCTAPAQEVMDAWWTGSPYASVGIYLGGSNQLCKDQPNLTADWVAHQQGTGWRVLSAWVGPQASCSGYADKMAADRPTAQTQGAAEADKAVAAAQALGLGLESTLYYDLEDYDIGQTDCRQASLAFVTGWTLRLHQLGYLSGVYSNIGAAINALDVADRLVPPGTYVMPDEIWYAWANGQADAVTDDRVLTDEWDDHARVHQYRIDTPVTYAGYTLTVDENWLDVGDGSTAARAKSLCHGIDVDLRRYPTLRPGRRGPVVKVAQCVLRHERFLKGKLTGAYDKRTVAAVRKAQKRLGVHVTGKLTRLTWTALFADGPAVVLKVGSTGDDVRRLQRSLTASGFRTKVDGVFTTQTASKVSRYQHKVGIAETGIATPEVWAALQA